MKKTIITALAMFALGSPLALAQPDTQHQQGQYQNQGQANNDQMRDHRGDNANQPRDRHGRRINWRDRRGNAHWDENQYNGYYVANRWHYGPPPENFRGNATFGYHRWTRGQRLGYYNGRYREVVDYRNHHLRAPRRGYHWVQDDEGDFLLAAIATGVIVSVILSND